MIRVPLRPHVRSADRYLPRRLVPIDLGNEARPWPKDDPAAAETAGIKESLAACYATTERRSLGWTRLFLRWVGWYFHFSRLCALRHINGHDANSRLPLGTDTDRTALDLLPNKFLDLGSVGVGFEVTPVSIICRLSHGFVPSTGQVVTTSFH